MASNRAGSRQRFFQGLVGSFQLFIIRPDVLVAIDAHFMVGIFEIAHCQLLFRSGCFGLGRCFKQVVATGGHASLNWRFIVPFVVTGSARVGKVNVVWEFHCSSRILDGIRRLKQNIPHWHQHIFSRFFSGHNAADAQQTQKIKIDNTRPRICIVLSLKI